MFYCSEIAKEMNMIIQSNDKSSKITVLSDDGFNGLLSSLKLWKSMSKLNIHVQLLHCSSNVHVISGIYLEI